MEGRNPGQRLLRFTTVGSVDDGKSTLIGRLLHDTRGVYDDQLDSVRKASKTAGGDGLDLSLITDGLRAEREQAITIDVAYRHFATPRRRFIIADTPGHEQYTRNMATGASTADLAVILIDACHGVLPQSRRHAFIASLLGIRRVAVAVNKMDLVGFRQEVFEDIRREFGEFSERLGFKDAYFVPVCAVAGDNVVSRSDRMPWFTGQSLLEYLETVDAASERNDGPFRFPVQLVIRPDANFRGYAGQIASGRVRPGDTVLVLPSGLTSRVASIDTWDGELAEAGPPLCPTICLQDHLDISRGDMLVDPAAPPTVARQFTAMLVWMSPSPLRPDAPYLLKHTTRQVCASVCRVCHTIDFQTLGPLHSSEVRLNDIAEVEIQAHHPLYFDPYRENRNTGSFILIDMMTNQTVGAGIVLHAVERRARDAPAAATNGRQAGAADHPGLTIWFTGLSGAGKSTICEAVRQHLEARGCRLQVLDGDVVRKHLSKGLGFSREDRDENIRRIGFVAGLLARNGVIVLAAAISPYRAVRDEVRASLENFVEVYVNAPVEVCEARDTKGLYKKARAGELRGFTGIDDPYEPPMRAEVECHTDQETLEESVAKVLRAVDRLLV